MRIRAAVVVALVVAGCGGEGSKTPPPPAVTGSFVFTNSSGAGVNELDLVPSTSETWGSPRNGSTILSGTTFTVDVPVGTYDARAVVIGAASTYFAYLGGIPIVEGGAYHAPPVLSSSFTGSMKVTNGNGTFSQTAVYVTPSGSGTWGPNQLDAALPPGATLHLVGMPADSYDVWCHRADSADTFGSGYAVPSLGYNAITCP